MPAMLVDPSSQIWRSSAKHSWIAASCSIVRTELLGASEVAERGGMGSGVIFSSTLSVGLVCEALDMGVEMKVGDRVEEGEWRA